MIEDILTKLQNQTERTTIKQVLFKVSMLLDTSEAISILRETADALEAEVIILGEAKK